MNKLNSLHERLSMITYTRYILHRLVPMTVFFVIVQIALRIAFLVREYHTISHTALDNLTLFGVGMIFDVATLSFFLLPFVLYWTLLPKTWHSQKADRLVSSFLYLAFIYILFFDAVAEWIFWDEFTVRYNFIAVDYLVYTNEVLKNIWESYPIVWLLLAIGAVSAVCFFSTRRFLFPSLDHTRAGGFITRIGHACLYLVIPVALFFTVTPKLSELSTNSYTNEISKNGIYSLFSAFRNNELDYNRFYTTSLKDIPTPSLRTLIAANEPGARFKTENEQDITRDIIRSGSEKHKNVIVIVMESMSAQFMERFGNTNRLTPHLDQLTTQSLFFSNLYATGTRTVRGLEAISLSIPPTPGTSIVKRQGNENLFSLGFIFKDRGYDTRFIYGGYGYFDNMNYFFEHNGFDIVDRANFADNEKTFANAWGLCDEDLFTKAMTEANKSYARKTPFMHMVMTTSNHRPYTFPEGKVNFPSSGAGRSGGVAYADYAIGKFLSDAAKEPWFNNTVFVIVADHTAGSAGKVELSPDKYHIPLFIYAPGFIKPNEIKALASQIDLAPTLLGLLNFSYTSRFYGRDLLSNHQNPVSYAFVANYQKLGLITDDALLVLRPGKDYAMYKDYITPIPKDQLDPTLLGKAITWFHGASQWRQSAMKLPTTVVKK